MIGFPIVDTHLHVWDLNRLHYPWLGDIPLLYKSYLLDDYNVACGSVEIERMVFVQCECEPGQFLAEAQWVTSLADEDDRVAGIVAFAPLEKGTEVRGDLEQLAAIPRVKGIRRIVQFEPDIDFCLCPDFCVVYRC